VSRIEIINEIISLFVLKNCLSIIDIIPMAQYNCKNYGLLKDVFNFYGLWISTINNKPNFKIMFDRVVE